MCSHDACPTLHKGPSVSLSDWALTEHWLSVCICVCVDEICEQQSTRSCSKRFNCNKKRRPTVKRYACVSIVQQSWFVVHLWVCLFVCAHSCVLSDSLCGLWGRGLALIGPEREGHTLTAFQRAGLKGLCGSCPAFHANPHDPHHRSTVPALTHTTALRKRLLLMDICPLSEITHHFGLRLVLVYYVATPNKAINNTMVKWWFQMENHGTVRYTMALNLEFI